MADHKVLLWMLSKVKRHCLVWVSKVIPHLKNDLTPATFSSTIIPYIGIFILKKFE